MIVCIVKHSEVGLTETFIRAHLERIPGETVGVHGSPPRRLGGAIVDPRSFSERAIEGLLRRLGLQWRSNTYDDTEAYTILLSDVEPDIVLAEYGLAGAKISEACAQVGVPLVVHFHGYDASQHSILDTYQEQYRVFFEQASAIVAVSRAMQRSLIDLGAPAEKVFHNPCGVDLQNFTPTRPDENPPVFVGVGRLVEKKAPHLTIQAFARVHEKYPSARLRMIGDGPLDGVCRDLIVAHGLEEAVTLLGEQPHDVVQQEMQDARAFVQHSVAARDGDSEGTPVAVLEAGASGLPVVSTRHAGIPDVIVEGETGFLVDERDVRGMAEHMVKLVEQHESAAELGSANRQRIEQYFDMESSISRLASILQGVTGRAERPSVVHPAFEAEAT